MVYLNMVYIYKKKLKSDVIIQLQNKNLIPLYKQNIFKKKVVYQNKTIFLKLKTKLKTKVMNSKCRLFILNSNF